MDFVVALSFSTCFTVSSILQIYLATELMLLGQYAFFIATMCLLLLDSLGLIYFIKNDNIPTNKKIQYWGCCLLQLEIVYVLIYRNIPMSPQTNIGARAFREYIFSVLNIVFMYTLQCYEIENTSDLAINGFSVMILRFYQLGIFLILYYRLKYFYNYALKEGIEAFIFFFCYYLSLGHLSTIQVGEYKCNLGLISLGLILTTSLIALLINVRQIRDTDQESNWIRIFIFSILFNSHPHQACSFGQKKPTIISSFINQFTMAVLLIVFASQNTYKDLQNFQDLSQNKKVMTVSMVITLLLNCYYFARFQHDFFFNSLHFKSQYVNSDEDLLYATQDLSSTVYLLNEVDIQFKNNYQPNSKEAVSKPEEANLIENKCNLRGCDLQFQFLKSVSHLLKNKVSVNVHDYNFSLCEFHTEELLSTEEFVEASFTQRLFINNDFMLSKSPLEILKERLTNGFLSTKLTETLLQKLPENKQSILRKMNSQSYQVIAFQRYLQEEITILPDLVLFDLYSIDV